MRDAGVRDDRPAPDEHRQSVTQITRSPSFSSTSAGDVDEVDVAGRRGRHRLFLDRHIPVDLAEALGEQVRQFARQLDGEVVRGPGRGEEHQAHHAGAPRALSGPARRW